MKSPSKRRKISTLSSISIPKRSRRYSVHAQNFMLNKEQERKAVFDSPEQRNLVMRLESDIINTIKVVDPSVCEYNYEMSIKKNEKEVTIDEYINRTKPVLFQYNSSVHRKKIHVTTYFVANEMKSGDKFGEMINDTHQGNVINQRVMTIITKEECDFGTLDKMGYNKCLREVSERIRK